jgi:MgtE-like protein
MKPAIAFIASFVVAAAGSTGAKVMLTKPAPVAADSTKIGVDSTGTDSTAAPSHEKPAAEGEHKGTAASAAAPKMAAVESTAAPTVTPAKGAAKTTPAQKSSAPAAPAAPATTDSVVEASERRLSKVFTAMEPKQAAKVLQHMEDADVQIILGYVGPRQAASIMAELPPERVATLSKRAMQAKTK